MDHRVFNFSAGPSMLPLSVLERAGAEAPALLVWSKRDLPPAPGPAPELPETLPVVAVSARTGEGLEELEAAVAALFPADGGEAGSLLTNQRQADAARRALAAVERAREGLALGLTPDAALSDVEEALSALGELAGRSVTEDVTDRIFSRFCVGK